MSDYSHFSLTRAGDDVVWLKIDVAGKSVNVMASDVMVELSAITRELAENPHPDWSFIRERKGGLFLVRTSMNLPIFRIGRLLRRIFLVFWRAFRGLKISPA